MDLERRELFADLVHIERRGPQEARIGAADFHIGREQPPRQPAEIPFRADVRTGPEQHVEAFGLRGADVLGDIEIAAEIELALLRLVQVPEDVGAEGVEAHGAHFAHAVAPVGAGNARVMHLAGADQEGLAVEEELVAARREGARLWLREGREGEGGGKKFAAFHRMVSSRSRWVPRSMLDCGTRLPGSYAACAG
jgi:hypothetical protein